MTFFASQERVHINTYLQHKMEINRNMTQDDNLRYPKTLWVDGEILTHAMQVSLDSWNSFDQLTTYMWVLTPKKVKLKRRERKSVHKSIGGVKEKEITLISFKETLFYRARKS